MARLVVPERNAWAIERLALRGNETVLEIGCGRGVAAALIGRQLADGRMVAIDRSTAATSAALARPEARAHVDTGRLDILTTALTDLEGYDAAFDIAFAINVNVFWLDPRREMPVIRRILKPGARLDLFYEAPTAEQGRKAARLTVEKLALHGFVAQPVPTGKVAPNLVHITAHPGK